MEKRTPTFGKSASIQLSKQQNGEQSNEGEHGVVHEEHYRALQHSPGFQNFRDQQVGVWSPRDNGFSGSCKLSNRNQSAEIADNKGETLAYMTTEGVELDMEGSSPTNATSPSFKLEATVVPKHLAKNISLTTIDESFSADPSMSQDPTQPGVYVTAGPASGSSTQEKHRSPVTRSFSGGPNNNSQGCKTPTKDPGFPTNTSSGRKVLYVPGSPTHHRRVSSRLSSLPGIPSPLGPKYYVNDLGSDVSGLVSPLSTKPEYYHRTSNEVVHTPQEFDLHALKVSASTKGSPYHQRKFGHDRKITDPFVEDNEKLERAAEPSPFMAQAIQNGYMSPSQIQVPGTPVLQYASYSVVRNGLDSPSTPNYQGFAHPSTHTDFRIPGTPVFHPFSPTTPSIPSFPSSTHLPPRVDLPIPPPPLSSVQDLLQHSAETRALLDVRAAIRAEWIRTEAKKIAELSGQSFAAAQLFQQTGLQEDYETWQTLSAAYDDATNLEKRQEERRNIFMPQGMSAQRTGTDSIVGDESAAFTTAREGEGPSEGKLLGFQMAYMERVCAEIKRRADEKKQNDEEQITTEMLETLSLEEKTAIRTHLVNRLTRAAAEREG
jgi:hypothetical protein